MKERATALLDSGVGLGHSGTAWAIPCVVRALCLSPEGYSRHAGVGLPVPA